MKQPSRHDARHLVILTGVSGSGKSTVLRAFEDMGFYCVDNLPVELIPIFAELHAAGEGDFGRAPCWSMRAKAPNSKSFLLC